eukprot:XP_001702720.1 predicted protein [Chlamydomonas reinhardtii]
MASRARAVINTAPREQIEGRVHKWERRWVVHKKGTQKQEVQLELLRWIQTEERCPDLQGPRFPHIKPAADTAMAEGADADGEAGPSALAQAEAAAVAGAVDSEAQPAAELQPPQTEAPGQAGAGPAQAEEGANGGYGGGELADSAAEASGRQDAGDARFAAEVEAPAGTGQAAAADLAMQETEGGAGEAEGGQGRAGEEVAMPDVGPTD